MKIKKRKLKAFTLIELLVVIAIISLLVSILLPSLNKAKDLAKRVVCASNIHGVGVTYTFYSSEHNGYMPLGWKGSAKQFGYLVAYRPGGGVTQYAPFGYLYKAGLMEEPKVFDCPSSIIFDLWWNPWPPDCGDTTYPSTRAGYDTRPEVRWDAPWPAPPGNTQFLVPNGDFPNIVDMGQKAIISDRLIPSEVAAKHVDGVNVGYCDGSAGWVDIGLIEDDLEGAADWGEAYNIFVDNMWDTLDERN